MSSQKLSNGFRSRDSQPMRTKIMRASPRITMRSQTLLSRTRLAGSCPRATVSKIHWPISNNLCLKMRAPKTKRDSYSSKTLSKSNSSSPHLSSKKNNRWNLHNNNYNSSSNYNFQKSKVIRRNWKKLYRRIKGTNSGITLRMIIQGPLQKSEARVQESIPVEKTQRAQ